jgi:hypothetical protein
MSFREANQDYFRSDMPSNKLFNTLFSAPPAWRGGEQNGEQNGLQVAKMVKTVQIVRSHKRVYRKDIQKW